MQSYIRRLGESFDCLRALMTSALPFLIRVLTSKATWVIRVWEAGLPYRVITYAYLPTAVGYERRMGESLVRCFVSGRGTSPLPAQSAFQFIPQSH